MPTSETRFDPFDVVVVPFPYADRLAEKRRQFLSALRARDVSAAARLMRSHLESVQQMLEQDPGSMSLHVALAEVQPGMRR